MAQLRNVDESLAKRIATGLAIELPEKAKAAKPPVDLKISDALSIQKQAKNTLKGRQVGILFAEGSDLAEIRKFKDLIAGKGGTAVLVAPRVGGIPVKGGTLQADGLLAGSPSVLFDAIISILMPDQASKLAHDSAAVQWFMDAYAHCKTIAHCKGTQVILDRAGVEKDDGVVPLDAFEKVGVKRHWAREPKVRDLA